MSVQAPAKFDAEKADNFEDIEKQFAVAVVEHMQAYEKLISTVPPNRLKLSAIDDILMAHLNTAFPTLLSSDNNYAALRTLDEDAMKSPQGKEDWRKFVMAYEKIVPDYNFGTLIRTDCSRDYAQDNTTLVLRTQFLAIEVARNRFGLNNSFHEEVQKRLHSQ
ncbi:putative polysaccharide biosynthesis protein [Mrakia frigida]|uniref:ribosome-associated Tef1p biogenesis chaperone CHP1 n=1 Tax=Mrakia frigida TaxID=29902 RepID=UPI003FCBF7C5